MADGNQEWTKSAKRDRRKQPDRRTAERLAEERPNIRRDTDGATAWGGTNRRVAHRRVYDRHQQEVRKESGRNKAIASWWSG